MEDRAPVAAVDVGVHEDRNNERDYADRDADDLTSEF
jgi:hypothetical protein